jgi:hypothetical protein
VTYRPDVLQTKASSVWTMWFSVRTLLCIEKLLFQLASVRTFQQLVRTTLSVRSSFRFSFKKKIWEDCCNHPDDVDSRPNALLLKVSSQFKLNHPDDSLPWFGSAYDKYRNCVQQITRPDGHPPSLDARSLYKEITCSGRATVRMTVPHRPDAALKLERFSAKISEFWLYSCPFGRPMSTVRMALSFIKPAAHLSPQPINRGPCT